MIEKYRVIRECKGGEWKVGQIITVDQERNYELWQYAMDKIADGAIVRYIEQKAVFSPENKAIIPPENKIKIV